MLEKLKQIIDSEELHSLDERCAAAYEYIRSGMSYSHGSEFVFTFSNLCQRDLNILSGIVKAIHFHDQLSNDLWNGWARDELRRMAFDRDKYNKHLHTTQP